MINFCAENKIHPAIEIIKMDYINEVLARLVNRDVKYRFLSSFCQYMRAITM